MNKHTVKVNGHDTSVFIEKEFWLELKYISKLNNKSISGIISDIDKNKETQNLSSAIRLYVLNHLKNK
ncbi:ribbon-helix-helix domain-containing protein [Pelagibacterales bacterium]|nr:ribbon-helix-helix domain-containing protein [Pelagibacterales bacterium]MDA7763832.1 ribbon-helix-helix domain-containing protein [Pelagibacterales bacterium]MDA9137085.1 ribbon-helix-helix domain-containing protein [Pelagibacterales bacterium]MDA9864631.1 ribbon-helix-helix domain-containing protein [Pelagibacterales bacterium]MDB9818378.1 ribbon-helix-helix domain-containing protein [Pelagibacterales bacterium]